MLFTAVDVISLITLIGSVIFGLFRRDLLMFVACLGLVALTQNSQNQSTSNFSVLKPVLITSPEYSQDWWKESALNLMWEVEVLIRSDMNRSVFIAMFTMIAIGSLFKGTAKNRNYKTQTGDLNNLYSSSTLKRTFIKTRFFIGWTLTYTIIIYIFTILVSKGWILWILEMIGMQNAPFYENYVVPSSIRIDDVFNSSYYRELVLLMTLICYDQDANTSISAAVVFAFLPTLIFSLGNSLILVLHQNGIALPTHAILDEETLHWGNYTCLIVAHVIMYLAWAKTLKEWHSEYVLFKMNYDFIANQLRKSNTGIDNQSNNINIDDKQTKKAKISFDYRKNKNANIDDNQSKVDQLNNMMNIDDNQVNELNKNNQQIQNFSNQQNRQSNQQNQQYQQSNQQNQQSNQQYQQSNQQFKSNQNEKSFSSNFQNVPQQIMSPSPLDGIKNHIEAEKSISSSSGSQVPPKIRKLSLEHSSSPSSVGHPPSLHKSVQNLVSGSLINLGVHGTSLDHNTTVGLLQLKLNTPTIVPFGDASQCISYSGKNIHLWDVQTHQLKLTFSGHLEPVSAVRLIYLKSLVKSPKEASITADINESDENDHQLAPNTLISGSWDSTVKIWDLETGLCVSTLKGHSSGITCINTFDNDTKVIVGTFSGVVEMWDLNTMQQIGDAYQQSKTSISSISVFSENSKFVASSFDGNVYIWNLSTKRCDKILKKHTKRVLEAVIYDSNTKLITASEDKTLAIWDLETGECQRVLTGHNDSIQTVAVYGDSQRAISGAADGQLIVWDIDLDTDYGSVIVSSLDDHRSAIISVTVFEDQCKLITYAMDKQLKIWDMNEGICISSIKMPPDTLELETPKEKREIELSILVAWDPQDQASIANITTKIAHEGHNFSVARSAANLVKDLEVGNQYDLILIDLALPQLVSSKDVISSLSNSAFRGGIVALTSPDIENNPEIQEVASKIKRVPGFLEITEKPLSDLSLGKICSEVTDLIRDRQAAQKTLSVVDNSSKSRSDGTKSEPEISPSSPSSSTNVSASTTPGQQHSGLVLHQERQRSLSSSPANPKRAGDEALQHAQERLNYVETLFTSFVPVQFFDMISPEGRDRLKLGDAVCKSVTVMFSDIRDFSSMSETMTVGDLMDFLNTYLAFAMPSIQEHGGFVDKFIGDSIMCLFAQDGERQSVAAVNCAVEMMSHLDFMKRNGFQGVETGIGINTGRTIIGLVGAETRMEPTVLGDAVNLASRLESLCKVYGSRVLVSEYTREKMGRGAELFTMRQLDYVAVKGKRIACRIYEVINADRQEVQKSKRLLLKDGLWDNALSAYQKADFQGAISLFEQCLAVYPQDVPSKIYIGRCKELIEKKIDAKSWDAVSRFSTK